jgi:serine/threonine protein phosphatase 1
MNNQLIFAFGDIHGCFKAAETAVKVAEGKNAQAIFLGDYIDRGPSAVKTLHVLMQAKQKHSDWIFLRGNHDQMLIDLILGKANVADIGRALQGEFGYWQAAKSFQEWKELGSNERDELFNFLNTSTLYHETSDFIFSHAVLRETQELLGEKSREELIWNYDYEPLWTGKPFVHGHLPVKTITEMGRGININTSCGYGGVLTGLILNVGSQDNYSFVQIMEDGSLFNP